jgi:hypothetical protein
MQVAIVAGNTESRSNRCDYRGHDHEKKNTDKSPAAPSGTQTCDRVLRQHK